MIDRSLLRKMSLHYRRLMAEDEFEKRNQSLCDQVEQLVTSSNIKSIHCFLPIAKNKEPNMTSLFPSFWKHGRRIMVSKTNFKAKTLTNYWLESDTKLVMNAWDIPEPSNAELAKIKDAELILVPLALADKEGNRIGYGGGFYDKLLPGLNARKIGLSLGSLVDKIDTHSWDYPLDLIFFPNSGN